ncbi:SEM5A-like protein [Mya arenaria]|uniref:SEM5A-like protein n=1 Tax=Mya arenaria TaxID=6604 RepID=A0ABY7EAQ0_MYAAR|nr:SEM5A-like protein [Mya arenaria]
MGEKLEAPCATPRCLLWCAIISLCLAAHQAPEFPREFDFRYISYDDLISESPVFKSEDIVDYAELLVDVKRNQLVVGARNVLFRLDLDDLTVLQEVSVAPTSEEYRDCLATQEKAKCHNFIRVLLLHNYTQTNLDSTEESAFYVCGTNAFKPICSWRKVTDLSVVLEKEAGLGRCPYDPSHNSTAIITSDGESYGATNLGPDDRDPAIYRKEGRQSKALRTAQSNSLWLNEPEFVSSYEVDDEVFFFFREFADEFINCGKRVYSRVARLCKADQGPMFEHTWTTFFKARLNCSRPGEFPFYYDEIQNTFMLEEGDQKLLYAVFNTPMNSIAGSAVCVFNMTAFNSSFNGPFKFQDKPQSAWVPVEQTEKLTQCPERREQSKRSNEVLKMQESKFQLMDQAVQPDMLGPLIQAQNERWTHVIVDDVLAKAPLEGGLKVVSIKVIFVATDDGRVRKLAHIPGATEPCMIEEVKIVPNGDHKPVKAMKLAPDKMAIYISTQQTVLKIPVHRCSSLCLNARDPYCGWDTDKNECTVAPEGQPAIHYWRQGLTGCPFVHHPVNGVWSEWSLWQQCSQVGGDTTSGDCLCRSRSCDNPAPFYGGQSCPGASVEVTNCTAHGQWTDWTEWSTCFQSCGSTAIRRRHRYCSNPPPRFGGRACVGNDNEDEYCPVPPVQRTWTMWADWSECSANCNGGFMTRRRTCSLPEPSADMSIPCNGNNQELRMCNTKPCEELTKHTSWTPWVITNRTRGGHFEQRHRFTCKANVTSSNMIRSVPSTPDTRFCIDGGHCHQTGEIKSAEIDTHSPIDRVLRHYCKRRKRMFRHFCKCRTLGIFLICQKCGLKVTHKGKKFFLRYMFCISMKQMVKVPRKALKGFFCCCLINQIVAEHTTVCMCHPDFTPSNFQDENIPTYVIMEYIPTYVIMYSISMEFIPNYVIKEYTVHLAC